ncbi:hypothetical protein C8Q77DRAFT_690272 [Trametes polyzona]|nr:hypothetical protein C8Q77DRAFT_690272 [Trametes polyzona]
MMAQNAIYPTVVAAGKEDSTALFLDLGCCMGTDVRKLVLDGYPAARVLGCDLRPEYIELGYELFGDADRCPIRFFTSNVFDLPTEPVNAAETLPDPSTVSDLSQLRGSLTHIYTGALFHLFDEETQYGLAVRLATLLRLCPGAVIFGRHQGLKEEGYIDDHLGRTRYGHSEESWPKLWQKVFTEVEGEDFAVRVQVQAKLTDMFWDDPQKKTRSSSLLYWSVVIA